MNTYRRLSPNNGKRLSCFRSNLLDDRHSELKKNVAANASPHYSAVHSSKPRKCLIYLSNCFCEHINGHHQIALFASLKMTSVTVCIFPVAPGLDGIHSMKQTNSNSATE